MLVCVCVNPRAHISRNDYCNSQEDEDDDELEQDENQEDLPSDDELRGQVEKIYK